MGGCVSRQGSHTLRRAQQIVKKDQAGQRKAARSGAARRPRDPLEDLRREIAVMRRSLHPNVVALREVRFVGRVRIALTAAGRPLASLSQLWPTAASTCRCCQACSLSMPPSKRLPCPPLPPCRWWTTAAATRCCW